MSYISVGRRGGCKISVDVCAVRRHVASGVHPIHSTTASLAGAFVIKHGTRRAVSTVVCNDVVWKQKGAQRAFYPMLLVPHLPNCT